MSNTITENNILESLISIYPSMFKANDVKYISVSNALTWIKIGRWADKVSQVKNGTLDKKELPAIIWGGQFKAGDRTNEGISHYSGLAPLDFDMKDSTDEDIQDKIDMLKADPFILAIWRSSSGKGIHCLMRIQSQEDYSAHYRAIISKYDGIDPACSNISRLLFVSHDPDIHVNEESLIFTDIIREERLILPSEPTLATKTDFRKLEMVCNLFLNAKEGERNHKMLKAGRLLGGFIAGGLVQEDIGVSALLGALETRRQELGEDDYKAAKITLNNGLEHGLLSPLVEIQDEFIKMSLQESMREEDLYKFIQTEQEGLDFLLKYKRGEFDKGLDCGYQELDPHFKFIKKALTVVLGHGHSGKTSFALWFLNLAARLHNWKWAVYCGENSVESVRLILNQYYLGKRIEDSKEEEIIKSNKWVSNRFIILKNEDLLEPYQVLDLIDKVRQVHSIDGALIDPFNYLKLAGKERYNAVIDAYTQFRNYSLKTGINLWLTAHTNTESQREDRMPTPAHAEMGSMLYNKADQFICVHRHSYDDVDGGIKNNGCSVYVAKTDRDQLYGLVKGKYKEPIEFRYTRVGFIDQYGLFPLASHNNIQSEINF
jgi:hypothetical protein